MDISSLNSASATSQYVSSLLSQQQQQSSTTGADAGTTSTDSLLSQLTASPADLKTQLAQEQLGSQQAALGEQLSKGLAASGVTLSGDVSFSLDANGNVTVDGSAADQSAVQSWFQQDTSKPSLESQIGSALKSAQTLSQTTQQDNAISMAARYAGPSSNLMSLYQQFMGSVQAPSPVMTLSGATSTLTYPGALNSQA